MKRWTLFSALLIACTLTAEELRIGNSLIELRIDHGKIELCTPGASVPAAVFAPTFEPDVEVRTFVVDRSGESRKIVRLTTPHSSVAIELPDAKPYIRLALNCNASPVQVTLPTGVEAVVLPDCFAEDAMLLPGAARWLPPFLNGYLMMLKDGSALTCLPINAHDDAALAGDFTSLTLMQKNTEDYIFVLNGGPDAWRKTAVPDLGTQKTLDDWRPPFAGLWQASFAVSPGFVPLGDGLRCNWNIASLDAQGKMNGVAPRFSVTQPQNCYGWLGGFEGSFRYPAVAKADGGLEITNPLFRNGSEQRYDLGQPLYLYAFYPTAGGQSAPGNFMEPWIKSRRPIRSTSFALNPNTCATTANFEKIFRREEGAQKREEIIQMLASMQCFVEGIRGRAENVVVWAKDMRAFAQEAGHVNPQLSPAAEDFLAMLDVIESHYQAALPRIQQPSAVEELSARVIALTEATLDADEIEDEAKRLGSAIRTIGGGQDSLVAELHHIVKCIRQRAIHHSTLAENPAVRNFWNAVYQRAEEPLQANYGHDGK